ncbi:MAG TPA: glycosyltransferase [Nitrososphaerales archaeon]|nr:glycosyltransferase [Nitrososphaerales archaeon]
MSSQRQTPAGGFTIGICASDSAKRLPSLVSFLIEEDYGPNFTLQRIAIVASGCPESVLIPVRQEADSEPRISLVTEPERRGKAEAINRIMENSIGSYLVMLNADAFPTKGSIRGLLEVASSPNVGAVSAKPVFDEGNSLLGHALALMWSAHSLMSLRLNHAGLSNHACDELIVVRRNMMSRLPANLVNDGAYIGGLARAQGLKVKFSTAAEVKISVPKQPMDLIRQRRRITFGHVQVWKKLGRPPRTIESMLFTNPLMSLKTIIGILTGRPRLILAVPLVLVSESAAILMGIFDANRSTEQHTVWRRNAD